MAEMSLGIIETAGLATAIEAADICLKSANVTLIGYEFTKGDGITLIKIEGNVGDVKAAIEASKAAFKDINKIVSAKIIPRPNKQIDNLIRNKDTVGLQNNNKNKNIESNEIIENIESYEINENIENNELIEKSNVEMQAAKVPEIVKKSDSEVAEVDISSSDEIKNKDIPNDTSSDLKNDLVKEKTGNKKEKYTCNICKDPKCQRRKGELKSECMHYKDK